MFRIINIFFHHFFFKTATRIKQTTEKGRRSKKKKKHFVFSQLSPAVLLLVGNFARLCLVPCVACMRELLHDFIHRSEYLTSTIYVNLWCRGRGQLCRFPKTFSIMLCKIITNFRERELKLGKSDVIRNNLAGEREPLVFLIGTRIHCHENIRHHEQQTSRGAECDPKRIIVKRKQTSTYARISGKTFNCIRNLFRRRLKFIAQSGTYRTNKIAATI